MINLFNKKKQEPGKMGLKSKNPNHWKNHSLIDIEGEIWKDCIFSNTRGVVYDFSGYYKVSNLGRVKGLFRKFDRKNQPPMTVKEAILKQSVMKRGGYLCVVLSRGNKKHTIQVGILVGRVFIANTLNKRTINHKWGDVKDNRESELEWHTYRENIKHSFDVLNRRPTFLGVKGANNPFSKKIICVTTGQIFNSGREAAEVLKCHPSHIKDVCKNLRKSHHGYVFKYY